MGLTGYVQFCSILLLPALFIFHREILLERKLLILKLNLFYCLINLDACLGQIFFSLSLCLPEPCILPFENFLLIRIRLQKVFKGLEKNRVNQCIKAPQVLKMTLGINFTQSLKNSSKAHNRVCSFTVSTVSGTW